MEESISSGLLLVFFGVAIVLFVIKVKAIVRAFRRKEWAWFFVLLFINTFGVLPIYYLLVIAKVPALREKAIEYDRSPKGYEGENPINRTL